MGIRNTIGVQGFVSEHDDSVDTNTLTITSNVVVRNVMEGQRSNTVSVDNDSVLTANSNSIIFVNAALNTVSVSLPDIAGIDGYMLKIKKIDTTSNVVSLLPVNGQLVDNTPSKIITTAYTTITIVSNNNDWWIV